MWLQEFDFEEQHHKGERIPHVDSLNRCFYVNTISSENFSNLLVIVQTISLDINAIK